MQISSRIINFLLAFLPSFSIFIASGAVLWGSHWFLIGRRPELGNERKFPLQILMLALTIVSILAIVIALPISESFRNKIIGLIGILLSGIIAFSSTNVIANLMAGVLLRITKPFRTGDFIRVGDFFGRVSERGLFDTEIQSESRELIALPNTYLVNNPVSTIRNSGAIVSVTLSLGYDVHHLQIESLLIQAAEESGLKDPFVNILELGNFSITYRISGLLTEVKWLITAQSSLFRVVLDTLHGQGIEIMSPSFMNQRRIGDDQTIIPTFVQATPVKETVDAEEIVFDKAEQAEQREGEQQQLIEDIINLETALKGTQDEKKDQVRENLEKKRERLKVVEQIEVVSNMETSIAEPNASTDVKKDMKKPHS
ncbi:MAG: mechanosensitive ion channel family protein [Proteobacteria bacterium]|nr:mechanosensitive ion channel [Desulfobulbaceae bacterium]MBU4152420.1 mechanosensitive ion channel family protein [Pseudomonadota bacterium]MDP2107345.1 mechanosensitive ion channel [Desulfobulbaceae bacterium]